jgi:sulfur-oxidizing protein SoxX
LLVRLSVLKGIKGFGIALMNLHNIGLALASLTMVLILIPLGIVYGQEADKLRVQQGKQLLMAKSKGNCLACHAVDDGELPGNIGPALVSMQLRFPDKATLYARIWDATEQNPDTHMPPFGLHGILTGEEIDLIVDYLYTL